MTVLFIHTVSALGGVDWLCRNATLQSPPGPGRLYLHGPWMNSLSEIPPSLGSLLPLPVSANHQHDRQHMAMEFDCHPFLCFPTERSGVNQGGALYQVVVKQRGPPLSHCLVVSRLDRNQARATQDPHPPIPTSPSGLPFLLV